MKSFSLLKKRFTGIEKNHVNCPLSRSGISRSLLFLFFFYCFIQYASAQNFPVGFSQVQVVGGITKPTVMAFSPDGRIFVAEQSGKLRVIKNGSLLATPFVQISVNSSGERGLIGVELDPDFASNHYIYLFYTVPTGKIHNRISRFTANGDVALAGSEKVILELDNLTSATNHNGGAMHFGKDGKLYVAVGENANGSNAQNLNNYLGKILRINSDGSVPAGNPFTGNESKKRIWVYGFRNPFTFSIQPNTGRMFVNDVGAGKWEEINDATTAGRNFGWPNVEGKSTNAAYINPVFAYFHGSGDGYGCAITGGTFFNPASTNYPSSFTGKYFYQEYCSNWINVLDLSVTPAARASFATGLPGAGVGLTVGNDGSLYYLSRTASALYKIIYNSNNAPAITSQPASLSITQGQTATFSASASGAQPLSYQWQKNGITISGANANSYTIASVQPANAGQYRVIVSNSAGSATSNAATLTVTAFNTPPTASITSPANHKIYRAGDVIQFSGTGSDPEEGSLPASAFSWEVVFHHDTHVHPGPSVDVSADGKSGTFEVPTEGETSANVWYELVLTVTDSKGLTSEDAVNIDPRVVTVSLASNPAGLQLNLDGQPQTTPYAEQAVSGMLLSLSAPATQTLNNTNYAFSNWTGGLGAGGSITVPDANTTYTANYTTATSGLRLPDNVPNPANGLEAAYYEGNWSILPNFTTLTPVKTNVVDLFQLNTKNRNYSYGFLFTGYVKVPSDGQYTFYTNSDDGSQLFIGSTLVVSNDGLHAAQERSGTIGLKAGFHAIKVSFFQSSGGEGLQVSYAGPGINKQIMSADDLYYNQSSGDPDFRNPDNPSNTVAGVEYDYYVGMWDNLPNFSSLTAAKSGVVNTFDISPKNLTTGYAFHYNGYVHIPTQGQYTFYTNSDDGSQLFIGSTLVVDNDGSHPLQERSGIIGLNAGYHAIEVNYFQRWGEEVLTVSYAGAGIAKQMIPASALVRNAAGNRMANASWLSEHVNSNDWTQVFPNPAKDYVTIRMYAERDTDVKVNITDVLSRNVSVSSHTVKIGPNDISVYVGRFANGLHAIAIQNGAERVVKKVMIDK
ncbi:MAG: PQQ-dependent sugar dehydrogenase [Bacteroidota bacterium]